MQLKSRSLGFRSSYFSFAAVIEEENEFKYKTSYNIIPEITIYKSIFLGGIYESVYRKIMLDLWVENIKKGAQSHTLPKENYCCLPVETISPQAIFAPEFPEG